MMALLPGFVRLFSRADTRRPVRRRVRIDLAKFVVYIIGDVHGCLGLLQKMEENVYRDGRSFRKPKLVIMLGDYIDRGAHSAGVISHLMDKPQAGYYRLCLCGNHEDMLMRFMDDPAPDHPWLKLGGDKTLASYGIDIHHVFSLNRHRARDIEQILLDAVPDAHLRFIRQMPSLAFGQNYVFVHAGIRPGIPLGQQTDSDLLWIREPFLTKGPQIENLTIIHGHTPSTEPQVRVGRIGLDTGAYATGRLTALRLHEGKLAILTAG